MTESRWWIVNRRSWNKVLSPRIAVDAWGRCLRWRRLWCRFGRWLYNDRFLCRCACWFWRRFRAGMMLWLCRGFRCWNLCCDLGRGLRCGCCSRCCLVTIPVSHHRCAHAHTQNDKKTETSYADFCFLAHRAKAPEQPRFLLRLNKSWWWKTLIRLLWWLLLRPLRIALGLIIVEIVIGVLRWLIHIPSIILFTEKKTRHIHSHIEEFVIRSCNELMKEQ